MSPQQLVPGRGELKRYLNAGLTQAQIVEAWAEDSGNRVSRSAIAMAMGRYGLKPAHERPRYEQLLPWRVRTEHLTHLDARMLRLEGRRRAKGEGSLSAPEARWLANWKAELKRRKAVVFYNPDSEEGFHWVEQGDAGDDTVDPNDEGPTGGPDLRGIPAAPQPS